jgi:2'-5' RNA ligase
VIRLFVALELPADVKAALIASMGGVAGARWQREDQLHLTLRFVGEVDRHTAQDIAAALGRVNVKPFTAELGEPGLFEHRGRVDSLWVGVRPAQSVAALARAMASVAARPRRKPPDRSGSHAAFSPVA